ncbi:UvrD-helicase domain-containing protein [Aquilutibacter rugosus]|uniref:UvrD-helicase domain-containing protein n=1 Tax=Aquilutibacter rugosus TaxID=3115820 RepID=UPI002F413F5A
MSAVRGWQDLNLSAPRRVLIEASAGTGKTFTIAVLYLRLLLGDAPIGDAGGEPLRHRPGELVLSTFTVAAAEELRQRVRQRIDDALQYADHQPPTNRDSLHEWLDARWTERSELRSADINHLRRCWLEMDAAPITTLHALCADILGEEPLLTGQDYLPRQMIESGDLQDRAMNALWRELQKDRDYTQWLQEQEILTRDKLMNRLKPFLQPKREYRVPEDYAKALAQHDRDSILALAETANELLRDKDLRFIAPAIEIRDSIDASLERFRAGAPWVFSESRNAATISGPHALLHKGSHKVDQTVPGAERFDAVVILGKIAEANAAKPVVELVQKLRVQIENLKESLRVRTFDDLLLGVHKALQADKAGAADLADRLFARWPVALIDEFQDTDAVQYEILDRIYRDEDGKERGVLGMVGDPKQSIYRFRGSDIEVYSDAVSKAKDNRLLLTDNYRSVPEYIGALNWFHAGDNASFGSRTEFVFEPIDDPERHQPIGRPALHIHDISGVAETRVGPIRAKVAAACAGLVVDLLHSRSDTDGKPITPDDLAILVNKHAEAIRLQRALRKVGVSSVVGRGVSVFESPWATELQLLLASAIYPSNPQRLRALLLSRLFGYTAATVHQLTDADQDAFLLQASRWNRLLHERGVLGMVEAFLTANHAKLSQRGDFDRLHTDLLHLAELLQVQLAQGAAMESLIGWMRRQRFENDSPDDRSRSRRMESEGGKVRIMTVHASKGLEFPYVLLPSAWDTNPARANANETPLVRIPGTFTYRPVFSDSEKDEFTQSKFDEDYRLLYVAMTRASVECHLFGYVPSEDVSEEEAPSKKTKATPKKEPKGGALARRLQNLKIVSGSEVAVHKELQAQMNHRYVPLQVKASDSVSVVGDRVVDHPEIADRLIRAHSFSALNKHAKRRTESLDIELENRPAADEAATDMLESGSAIELETAVDRRDGLWAIRGEQIGNLLHKTLELALPQPDADRMTRSLDSAMEFESFRLTSRQLEAMTESQFKDAMLAWLWQIADVPLLEGSSVTLGNLPGRAIRRELDFHLSIRTDADARGVIRDRIDALRNAGEFGRAEDWQRVLDFIGAVHMQGFLKGSADLVFEHEGQYFVLDYKSNVLDGDPANFSHQRIDTLAMRNPGGYWMQAFLYTLVLHRLLRDRLGADYDPQTHLGGAIYVFARGIGEADAGPRGGIWHERFDLELIEAADALLSGMEDEA